MKPRTPRRVALMLDLVWTYKRHTGIFSGTQQYADEHGWISIIDEFVHKSLPARRGAAVPYDGIIARANRQLVARAARLGIPVVNVWQSSPARRLVPGVYPDSKAVGALVVDHLITRGFRNFATLTFFSNVDLDLETREFIRVVDSLGLSCVSEGIPQDPWLDYSHWRKSVKIISKWMDRWRHPIGVYIGSEGIGRVVIQECHRRGWRVPTDVAIIAGKNEAHLCERPRPSFTSVEIGYERVGYEAARLLDRLMDGEPPPAQPIRTPPQGLVVRESTDFFAVDDEMVAAALQYIAANSQHEISPHDVARAIGAETRTLHNHFRKALDRPIAAEIRRVRIERAKRELAQSKLTLSEIAHNVGFGTIQRLYEIFQRELGISPSDYRKQRQVGVPHS